MVYSLFRSSHPTGSSPNTEKKNFLYNVLEGALWVTGGSLVSTQTVLPALITRLGGSNVEIGALGAIVYLGLFLPQIFSARYAQGLTWKKPLVIRFGILQRFAILFIGIVVLLFGESHPQYALWGILFIFTCNQLILGVITPIWFDLITKLTPLQKRGILNGARNTFAGILSLLASFLLTWLLTTFHFPLNYALAGISAFLLQLSAITFQARLVEAYPSETSSVQSPIDYFRELLSIARENHAFRTFLFCSVFLILATIPTSFFTVYAIKRYNASEGMIGTFTLITVCGQIIGALVNGRLADRFGNKIALISSSCSILCSSACALLAPSLFWFNIVFFCVGIFLGSELMTRYNLAVEYGPVHQRAIYIGLMNTFLAPLYFAGMIGGLLSDLFGYEEVFIIGIIFSVVGISMLIFRVHEPRTNRVVSQQTYD